MISKLQIKLSKYRFKEEMEIKYVYEIKGFFKTLSRVVPVVIGR